MNPSILRAPPRLAVQRVSPLPAPDVSSRYILLQDWTTVRSSLASPFVQDIDSWLDLDGYADISGWIEIAALTPPGGNATNSVQVTLETSPSRDDAYFLASTVPLLAGMQAPFVQPSSVPSVLRSVPTTLTTNLLRYLRWKITPIGSGAWDLTFRIHIIPSRSSTFVPTLIPGCVAWFRADLGVVGPSSGSTGVGAWNDQSGTADANKNLTSHGVSASQFNVVDGNYFGASTISFTGGQYLTSGSWTTTLTQNNTWIIIGNRVDTSAQMTAIDGASMGLGQLMVGNAASSVSIAAGATLTTGASAANDWTKPSAILAEFAGAQSAIYVNNFRSATVTGPAGSTNFGALCVGSQNPSTAPGNYWNGTIAEIIAYNGLLSGTYKSQLRNYFFGRYGIAIG